jgi:DNA (cytosine-5)-methyltransferase 1
MLTLRGLDRVLGDLSEMGYDARWGVVGACHVGAPHRRERIWITARRDKFLSYSQHNWTGWGQQQQESVEEKTGNDMVNSTQLFSNGGNDNSRVGLERESFSKLGNNCGAKNVANPMCKRQSGQGSCWYASDPAEKREGETDRAWSERVGHIWGIESRLGRVADGVANRVDRLKAIGNGQVPLVAATAFRILKGK